MDIQKSISQIEVVNLKFSKMLDSISAKIEKVHQTNFKYENTNKPNYDLNSRGGGGKENNDFAWDRALDIARTVFKASFNYMGNRFVPGIGGLIGTGIATIIDLAAMYAIENSNQF